MIKVLGVIPARYASTRFPAKALVDVGGKSLVQRVYEQATQSKSLARVIVATDHEAIFNHVKDFGGTVCMTQESHTSGTDRCQEALTLQSEAYDYVINIQGDEPFIQPAQIDLLASALGGQTEIATLVKPIKNQEQLFSPNIVKVVFNANQHALYFSRSVIPCLRNVLPQNWLNEHTFYKHIGMYAYRTDVLEKITRLPLSRLEKAESLEQLRWLENGFVVRVIQTSQETIGIDTPEDLSKALEYLKNQ